MLSPALEDLYERAGDEFGVGEPRPLAGFLLGYRATTNGPQEVVEQPLARRGVVEDVADQSGLGGFLDKVLQALTGRVQAFQEKGVDGGVSRGQLRGMQVPALVEAV